MGLRRLNKPSIRSLFYKMWRICVFVTCFVIYGGCVRLFVVICDYLWLRMVGYGFCQRLHFLFIVICDYLWLCSVVRF